MTEPDEALLWARADAADLYGDDAPRVLAGEFDSWPDIMLRVRVYRAGQAASAERIKALEEAMGALANAADNVGIAFFDSDDMPAETEAMQAATLDARALLKEAGQSGADLLQWLIDHTALELSFQHSDDDDPLDGAWCVHRQQGSANDREWCLIASGQTPWQALFLARVILLKEADQ